MNDFVHHFQGFWDTQARCHIRILDEKGKPLVIICSQGNPVRGTSITNAAEDIYKDMQNYLANNNITLADAISKYIDESRWTKMLLDLISALQRKKLSEFALESLKLALERHENFKEREDRIRNLIWLEHYPKGLGTDSPWNMVVSFDDDTWTPNWRPVLLKDLSNETGYTIDQLDIPRHILDPLWD